MTPHEIVTATLAVCLVVFSLRVAQLPTQVATTPAAAAQCQCETSSLVPAELRAPDPPPRHVGEFVAADGNSYAGQFYGAVRVHGTLDVTGDVRAGGASLWRWQAAFDAMAGTICADTDCGAHGVPAVLTDCLCICDPGWSGAACTEFDCHGHAIAWADGRCVCSGAWDPDTDCQLQWCHGVLTAAETCATDTPPPPETCSGHGVAVDDVCVCTTEGAAGLACQYVCATRAIDNAECVDAGGHALRGNWGHDMPPRSDTHTGVCGGGYTASPTEVAVSTFTCPANSTFEECEARWAAEAPLCCAPGALCDTPPIGVSDAVACALTSAAACRSRGCALCPTAGAEPVCVAREYAAADCDAYQWATVDPGWTTWTYACPGESRVPGTLCDPSARAEYLAMYAAACNITADVIDDPQLLDLSAATPACLAAARALVNAAAWPQLAVAYPALGAYVTITTTSEPTCATGLTLGMLPHAQTYNSLGGPAVWSCWPEADPAAFRLQLVPPIVPPSAPNLVAGSSMYVMTQDAYGYVYCLAGEPPDADEAAQLLAYEAATDAGVWRQVTLVTAHLACGAFRVDQTQLMNPAWTLALVPDATYTVGQAALNALGADASNYYVARWRAAAGAATIALTVHA
jgi:hypothetical protein